MAISTLQRYLCLLLIFIYLLSSVSVTVLAENSPAEPPMAETTEPVTEPTESSTEPTQTVTEPTEEPTEPTQETSEPTEAPTEPTQEASEPTEAPTEPTQEASEPTEAPTEPTQEVTEPTEAPTEPTQEATEPAEDSTEPSKPEADSGESSILSISDDPADTGPGLYFGQLHAHSSLSEETDTPDRLFQNAADAGLDFFALTNHSDSLDNAHSGSLSADGSAVSQDWAAGKAAAEAATGNHFTGISGFEMSWPEEMQLGHISTFNTSGFQSWTQDTYRQQSTALQNYYNTLSSVPGAIGQFNHPGNQYGTFSGFDYFPEADRVMALLEVGSTSDGYRYYTQALDKGWHVAPTNNRGGSARTVIYAQSLTESGLYTAMQNRRVYATEDSDLEIFYTLDDFFMGSIVKKRHIGQTADILVDLYDPTDSAIGLVEVIADGGEVADRKMVSNNTNVLSFSLPADDSYYYLRITQPDGQTAVTAPVWVEATESLGISDLVCETTVPVQNEDVALTLALYNRENADFLVEHLQILADDTVIAEDETLSRIPAGSEFSHDLRFSYDGIGLTEITVILSGTLEDSALEYEESITISFRQSRQVTDIIIDGNHENAGLSDLDLFKAMAAEEDIRLTVAADGVTREQLKDCRLLVVTAPGQPFSEAFLSAVSEYIGCGGSILVCSQSAHLDGDGTAQLNRLLEAIGSTMALNSDTVTDSMYNGGEDHLLFLDNIDTDSPWCAGITGGQVYRHDKGCSVAPGNGTALVRTHAASPAAVFAWEETASGGAVFAAGSLLPGNNELKEPSNIWDAPYANRTIAENLLNIGGEVLPLSTIRQAREAENGTVLRIRGYVTAGTSNPYNRFPDTLYLQDDTGGIAVIPFTAGDISVGTPVEITGAAEIREGNRILKPISWEVLGGSFYRYLPRTGDWKTLLDPWLYGGELVEVEGTCREVILADDGCVSAITLKDSSGNNARILVEDYIFSRATGENELHKTIRKNCTVRAMGLLHVDETGDTVIRVRNCEEVVYIPPRDVYINPRTGDILPFPAAKLLASAAPLILTRKKHR